MPVLELRIDLPEDVTLEDARLCLALRLFEESKISLGAAADLAGRTKPEFIDELGSRKIPVWNYLAGDFAQEAERCPK